MCDSDIDSKDDDVYLDLGDEGLGLDIDDVTSPSIDSATTPNATTTASQNLQFKEELEYDHVGRLRIIPYHDGVKECRRIIKGVDKDGDGFVNFEEFKQMMASACNISPHNLFYYLNFLNGGVDVPIPKTFKETHKKKNSDGTREEWVEPRTKEAHFFPNVGNFASISRNVEEMEAMRTKIKALTQHCAKFAMFEALVKKHIPQVFEDGEDSESDD
ncbi:hypothetical protein FXO37_25009 [Capsicum annuum]|nr:hypothetical protein FXO37_25009 [Capsicum annuum]